MMLNQFRARWRGRWIVPALAAAVLSSAPAFAESDNGAAAQALFQSARSLAAQGRYAEACPKFEESDRLEAGIGTEFHLAKCWEALGRNGSAWALYLKVASQAKAHGQNERAAVAEARAAALEPRLSRLRIVVSTPEAGLEVLRDSTQIGEASWNVAVPLDSGDYMISARAPGRGPFQVRVHVPAEPGTVSVSIPELEPLVSAGAAPNASGTELGARARAAPPPRSASGPVSTNALSGASELQAPAFTRPLGYTLAGLGLLSVGAGVGFALDFAHACPTREACHGAARDRAKTDRELAYVSWAVGGTAIASAAALLLLIPPQRQSSAWLFLPECSKETCVAHFFTRFE